MIIPKRGYEPSFMSLEELVRFVRLTGQILRRVVDISRQERPDHRDCDSQHENEKHDETIHRHSDSRILSRSPFYVNGRLVERIMQIRARHQHVFTMNPRSDFLRVTISNMLPNIFDTQLSSDPESSGPATRRSATTAS